MVKERFPTGEADGLLHLQDVAKMLHVSPNTLRRWSSEGKLKSVRINRRGDRRYRSEDVELFLKTANQWKKT